jgi:hypothetical protein
MLTAPHHNISQRSSAYLCDLCVYDARFNAEIAEIRRGPLRIKTAENKNVARSRFEYSHSPDNRALTKRYSVTTYLVAN